MVPRLLAEPLADVARAPDVGAAFVPLRQGHEAFIALVKAKAVDELGTDGELFKLQKVWLTGAGNAPVLS